VGYGCTTLFGNSGRFPDAWKKAIADGDIYGVASVLSGNRNLWKAELHRRLKPIWVWRVARL